MTSQRIQLDVENTLIFFTMIEYDKSKIIVARICLNATIIFNYMIFYSEISFLITGEKLNRLPDLIIIFADNTNY